MNRALLVFLVVILLALGASFMVPGVRHAIVNLAVYGRLSIADDPPNPAFFRIFVKNDAGNWVACPITGGSGCQRTPTPGQVGQTVEMMTEIYDPNGDCDTYISGPPADPNAVIFYVCMNQSLSFPGCTSALGDPDGGQVVGAYQTKVGNYCNFTANYVNFDYWKKYGIWYINVSARDNTATDTSYKSINRSWYDVISYDLRYPYPSGDSIYLGTVAASGAWTPNIGVNTSRNFGNIRLNVSFQSNNFTCADTPACQATPINIDNVNERYCIDNDTTIANGCGLDSVYFNANPQNTVWRYFNNGIRRCGVDDCSSDEDGAPNEANYSYSYHILVSPGKQSGNYNNTINIVSWTCDPATLCGSGHW